MILLALNLVLKAVWCSRGKNMRVAIAKTGEGFNYFLLALAFLLLVLVLRCFFCASKAAASA